MNEFEDKIIMAKEKAKERNFTQSVDLIINLKNVDLNNPENRFRCLTPFQKRQR